MLYKNKQITLLLGSFPEYTYKVGKYCTTLVLSVSDVTGTLLEASSHHLRALV